MNPPPDDGRALTAERALERARAIRKAAYDAGKADGREPAPQKRGPHINTAPESTYDDLSHSDLAEQAVLGGLLLDNSGWARIAGRCCEDEFYRADHRVLFACIGQLIEAGKPADVVTVTEALGRAGKLDDAGGASYVAALVQNTPSAVNIRPYAEIVRERAVRRNARGAFMEYADRVVSPGAGADLGRLLRDATEAFDHLSARGDDGWPAPIDLAALSQRELLSPRHIVPGWLPESEVALFAGHGGAGKSEIALHLGACIALGRPWCGIEVAQRPVCYISCEDGRDILHWRLSRIAQHLGVSLDGELSEWLRVIDATRIEPELMIAAEHEEPKLTALYTELSKRITPDSVTILDGASDVYGASEIVRRHVRRFIRALRRLAGEHGAVLLIAHVDKVAARNRDSSDRYSGSTAWHNSVRARWELGAEPKSEEMVLALAKANHAKAGAEIRLRWDATAHMHLPVNAPADEGIVGSIRERTEGEAILTAIRGCMRANPPITVPAALTGPRTTWHVLSERPEFPAALKSDERAIRARFARHLEQLRQAGKIRAESVRNEARKPVSVLVAHEVRES